MPEPIAQRYSAFKRSESRQCSRCKKWKPISQFPSATSSSGKRFIRSRCENCHNKNTSKDVLEQNNRARESIHALIRQHGPLTTSELSDSTGIDQRQIGRLLIKLTIEGEIVRIKDWGLSHQSLYAIPEQIIPISPRGKKSIAIKQDGHGEDDDDSYDDSWYHSLHDTGHRELVHTMRGRV